MSFCVGCEWGSKNTFYYYRFHVIISHYYQLLVLLLLMLSGIAPPLRLSPSSELM